MKTGTQVNVNRIQLASAHAAALPSFIFWNPGTVSKVSKASGLKRVAVRWAGHEPFWFDADILMKV